MKSIHFFKSLEMEITNPTTTTREMRTTTVEQSVQFHVAVKQTTRSKTVTWPMLIKIRPFQLKIDRNIHFNRESFHYIGNSRKK